ncbi:MAG: efflux transporter outer membrane subunit [Opitutales bacterium]|nr:efflux transporter outer membrane subunit [Opitutales bacterium]
MKKSSFYISLFALALGGCWTMAPDYERPQSPVGNDRFNGAGTQVELGAGHAAFLGWRHFYKDETLCRLMQQGLENNRDLRVAVLNIEKLAAAYRINRSLFFPSVNGNASWTRTRTPETVPSNVTGSALRTNNSQAVGLISYELDIWGRIKSLNDAAYENYLRAAEVERTVRITLAASIAQQYYAYSLATEQLEISQKMLALAKEYRDIVSENYNSGLVSELDFSMAEAQYQQTVDSVEQLKAAKAQAYNALQLLVGSQLPETLVPGKSLTDEALVADLPAGLPSELLTARPDILAAEHALKAANANIGAARAAFFPSVTLTASAGWAAGEHNELLHRNARTWQISPSVNLPIFNGGRLAAELDVAKLEREVEIANYEKAIQAAFKEVSDEFAVANTIEQRVAAQDIYLKSEKRRYEIVRDNYDCGNASSLDVILAHQAYFGAQQSALATRFERVCNKIRFYKALGGGWTAEAIGGNEEIVSAGTEEGQAFEEEFVDQNLVPTSCEAMAKESLEDFE